MAIIPAFIITILFSIPLKRDVKFLPKITVPVLLLILLISLLMIFYPHDTFGGRDESIYSNYAIHLTQNGSLNFSSYLNNLPDNFVENVKITPPAYTIYLAIQQTFFGIQGLLRGNLIIIILGLGSFFLVSSYLGGNKIGLIATILFSSSMPFLWFSRETMSENLSLFLLWTLLLFFFLALKSKQLIYMIVVFICSWLFALTRLEGFLLQFILLLIIPSTLFFLKSTSKKNILYITLFLFLVVVSNLLITRDTVALSLTKTMPNVNYSIKRDLLSFLPKKTVKNITESTITIKREKITTLYNKMPIFFAQMLAKYNFLLVMFSIFLVTCQFLIQIKKHSQTKLYYLLILLILIPEFYKFISPGVTIDEPWLYRRYMYALLPLGYLCLTILLSQLKNKKLLVILLSSLFMINIILSKPILFLKNNWLLVDKLNEITKDISRNDFVIVEKSPLGYYSPGSFLIINKGIRSSASSILWLQHFFPREKVFNGIHYNKIFLLSADNKDVFSFLNIVSQKLEDMLVFSSFKIVSRKSVDVEYTQLIPSCQLYLLGNEEGLANPYNIRALSFSSVEKYCSLPKNEIVKHNEQLYLYELIYENEKN